MRKEGELPPTIDPADPGDPHERARIMRAFERRLDAGGLRVAGPALARTGAARLGQRIVEIASRRPVSDAGRFADRLPPAAQLAARRSARRRSACAPGRSRSRRAMNCRIRRSCANLSRRITRAPWPRPWFRMPRANGAPTQDAQDCVRTALAVEPRDETPVRVHAAGRAAGGLSRASWPPSRRPPPSSRCRSMSRATRRRPIRGSTSSR